MQAYYKANKAQFDQPATRTVRHILVKTKAEAAKVRALLAANDTAANWAKVAKKYSIDTGTKNSRRQPRARSSGARWSSPSTTRPSPLPVNTISAPVKSQYGWHVLEVTAITPAKKSTYASAKANIKSTLTSQMQQKTWQAWLAKATKAAAISYAAGFNPDTLTASPSPAPSPSSS